MIKFIPRNINSWRYYDSEKNVSILFFNEIQFETELALTKFIQRWYKTNEPILIDGNTVKCGLVVGFISHDL